MLDEVISEISSSLKFHETSEKIVPLTFIDNNPYKFLHGDAASSVFFRDRISDSPF